jgi:hypothetical protein
MKDGKRCKPGVSSSSSGTNFLGQLVGTVSREAQCSGVRGGAGGGLGGIDSPREHFNPRQGLAGVEDSAGTTSFTGSTGVSEEKSLSTRERIDPPAE